MNPMKVGLIFCMLFLNNPASYSQEISLQEVRKQFQKAAEEEDACFSLLEILEPVGLNQPVLYGYKGAARMMSAKYVFNPIKKLSNFKKGKQLLNEAIAAANDDAELRYLRLALQKNSPGFLGYNQHIDEDTDFLKKNLSSLTDDYLIRQINAQLKDENNASD